MSKPRRSWGWLQGLACGAVVCLATPTAVLLGALLFPGMVALPFDREPGKPVARAMLLCGAAFGSPAMQELWARGHTISLSIELLQAPGTLAWAWAGACAGWLVREGAWLAARMVGELTVAREHAALMAERAKLQLEWSIEAPGLPEAGRAASN